MENMLPSWILPFWIIGAPIVFILVNYLTSRNDGSEALRYPNAAGNVGTPSMPAR